MSVQGAGDGTARAALVDAARKLHALGLNRTTSGNLSVRTASGFLVTPSALSYERMEAADVVAMSLDGAVAPSSRAPSTEWRFHRDIYRTRADAGAIVHTHAPFVTTLACLDRGIPAFHYMVSRAGGHDIRCAPYATFGSQALSDHALAALQDRKACLLAHHGSIALGESLDAAVRLAIEVETMAELYWRALQIAEPRVLDREEMARVAEAFRYYGNTTHADDS